MSLVLSGLLVAGAAEAQPVRQPYAVPPPDAPELAALGAYAIGTQTLSVDALDSVVLSATGIARMTRTIKARVWYPADAVPGAARTTFAHALPRPDGTGAPFAIPSLAVDGAAPIKGKRFPLVVVSHGYNGWDTFMTWLTENLATKGYVVVAIDHADQRVVNPADFPVSFGNVLIHRARDVRFIIDDLTRRAGKASDPLGQAIDANAIGLVGYSMGGFGVLGAAGLDYAPTSPVLAQLPAPARDQLLASQAEGKALVARIKGVVALAPFGGSPAVRVWSEATLAAFAKPVLLIDGDQDDIVDAPGGVSWLFAQMAGNQRHFLLYQNARHNVGGNPPPPEADADFSTREYFAEPVWRTERINAINQHFITAFLDLHLKGDEAKRAYLDVTPPLAGDGQWPLVPFQNVGGRPASAEQAGFWRGFQQRWALGLEMRKGEPAKR
ncbi:dienelactone hydrolase family protein [Novosphingobium sp.]|uniref:alpha/beta hydrolase family protein n=1 Tax=Novosphingobium sp. TaxID=1874826 RepID=UPI0026317B85|nr:dienelactone hydrolase family protein [Novosphingobium sp.]